MSGTDADRLAEIKGWLAGTCGLPFDHVEAALIFVIALLDAATSRPEGPTMDEQLEAAVDAPREAPEALKEMFRQHARPSAPGSNEADVDRVDDVARAICQRQNAYKDACIAVNDGGKFSCICGRRDGWEADARAALSAIGQGEGAES